MGRRRAAHARVHQHPGQAARALSPGVFGHHHQAVDGQHRLVSPKGQALAAAQAVRRPVKAPGPRAKAMASRSLKRRPAWQQALHFGSNWAEA